MNQIGGYSEHFNLPVVRVEGGSVSVCVCVGGILCVCVCVGSCAVVIVMRIYLGWCVFGWWELTLGGLVA